VPILSAKLDESVVLAALACPGTLLALADRSIDSGGTWKSPEPGMPPVFIDITMLVARYAHFT
jgi:hypothetical protein